VIKDRRSWDLPGQYPFFFWARKDRGSSDLPGCRPGDPHKSQFFLLERRNRRSSDLPGCCQGDPRNTHFYRGHIKYQLIEGRYGCVSDIRLMDPLVTLLWCRPFLAVSAVCWNRDSLVSATRIRTRVRRRTDGSLADGEGRHRNNGT